jgi:hypothetical protein
MNNNTILAIVFLMAGTLLTTAVTMLPAAYAGGDNDNGDGNKQKVEDESAGSIADCDDNEVERAGFDCIPIAEIGGNSPMILAELGDSTTEASQFEEQE